jgi:iron complex outermembrane receptor protein
MKSNSKLRVANRNEIAPLVRLSPVAAACAALFAVSMPVAAQQAQPAAAGDQKLEDISIVGNGFRKSIEDAVALKRGSDEIIEAISAEDLGKMPDVSIGEALARLPGLATQRVNGRAQVVSLRGLGPDFTGTTLNGREMVTTGDNRGVEFDQFPAELLNSVIVYKTPEAGLLGQGLAGTVDMRTVRPLDAKGREIVVNARAEDNRSGSITPEDKNKGKRLSVSYVNQFDDNKLGVALGLAYLDTPVLTQKQQIWGYDQNAAAQFMSWGGTPKNFPAANYQAWLPNGNQVEGIGSTNKRTGAMAVIEFKPNKDVHSTLDLYYSKFDQEEHMHGLFWYQGVWAGNANNWVNPQFATLADGSSFVKSATVTDLNGIIVRNDYNQRNDNIKAIGWNTTWNVASWKTSADLSYSNARSSQSLFETYAGQSQPASGVAPGSITYSLSMDPNQTSNATFVPSINYADPTVSLLGDPGGYGHDGRQGIIDQKDTMSAIRLGGKYDFTGALKGVFHDVDLGLDYSERRKSRNYGVSFAYLNNGLRANGKTSQQVSPDLLYTPIALGFAGVPGVMSYNIQGVAAKYYNFDTVLSQGDLQQDYTVKEKISTAYAKFDIDSEIAKVPLRGNLGIDWVHSDQSSQAFNTGDTGTQTAFGNSIGKVTGNVDAGTRYNDFLPSLNLIAELPDEYVARFSLAKTMARPRMDLEKASTAAAISPITNPNGQPSTTSGIWSGSGGNPSLQPWRAKSVDFALEKYFGKRSYVEGAFFYKHLDSWVSTKTVTNYDFSGFHDASGLTAIVPFGSYSTPINREGGTVHGGEFSTSMDLGNFSKRFDGFGVIFSEAITLSSVKDDPTQPNLPLPNLSHTVRNYTFYYEKDGVSMRVGEHYRSEFRGEVGSLFGTRTYDQIMADKQYDAQASYEFTEGSLKGLNLMLQMNNLTNAPYRTTQNINGNLAPREFDLWGRSMLIGFSYKVQ